MYQWHRSRVLAERASTDVERSLSLSFQCGPRSSWNFWKKGAPRCQALGPGWSGEARLSWRQPSLSANSGSQAHPQPGKGAGDIDLFSDNEGTSSSNTSSNKQQQGSSRAAAFLALYTRHQHHLGRFVLPFLCHTNVYHVSRFCISCV